MFHGRTAILAAGFFVLAVAAGLYAEDLAGRVAVSLTDASAQPAATSEGAAENPPPATGDGNPAGNPAPEEAPASGRPMWLLGAIGQDLPTGSGGDTPARGKRAAEVNISTASSASMGRWSIAGAVWERRLLAWRPGLVAFPIRAHAPPF